MKRGVYRTLAWTGVRNNRKLYVPYLLTCAGMVMMCYIMSFLGANPAIAEMRGGDTMQSILGLGFGVLAVFSVIFLFYTNSFLIRRRTKEFGLYNILGLGKRHLALVLLLETAAIAAVTLCAGLALGIVFSKLAELMLVKLMEGAQTTQFSVGLGAAVQTALLFALIHALIYGNALRRIRVANPVELLHSERAGEKPPKANWLPALLGAALLGTAYYLAVSIQDPMTAIVVFFFAVVMVVAATYLLFISGSVTFCRLLQKNRRYYYKTNHFVSVSSMAYRMKRNGAGLASICILCTMVLVMVSSTVCLYFGAEGSLRTRYARQFNLDVIVDTPEELQSGWTQAVRDAAADTAAARGLAAENELDYRVAAFGAPLHDGRLVADGSTDALGNMWQVFLVPLDDYNRLAGREATLADGEVLLCATKGVAYPAETLQIGDGAPLAVRERVEPFVSNAIDAMQIVPSLYVVVPDFARAVRRLEDGGADLQVALHWYYAFDLPCGDEAQREVDAALVEALETVKQAAQQEGNFYVGLESRAVQRANFLGLYGGLLYLGVLLGIVFLAAAVLIIYYKQVSEGYEDQARFGILQQVGMTRREIRRSVNSQLLTVFFLPLVTAGVHLSFAFPMIQKMLLLFGLADVSLLIVITACCYLVFALFYMAVYRATSRAYVAIVSDARGTAG